MSELEDYYDMIPNERQAEEVVPVGPEDLSFKERLLEKLEVLEKTIKKFPYFCTCGNPTFQKLCFILFILLFSIVIPIIIVQYYPLYAEWPDVGYCTIPTKNKIPCLIGRVKIDRALCVENDCCWDGDEHLEDEALRCYQREPSSQNYDISDRQWDGNPLTLLLTHTLNVRPFGQKILDARLTLTELDPDHLQVQLEDARNNMSAPPSLKSINFTNIVHLPNPNHTSKFSLEVVDRRNPSSFVLAFTRGAFILTEKFAEITLSFHKHCKVYGLSSPRENLFHELNRQTVTVFSNASTSLLSSHPVLMFVNTNTGASHAVFLEDFHLLTVTFHSSSAIIFRTTAPAINLHVLLGSTPIEVIEHLSHVIGKPSMPPFWALGPHFCFLNNNQEKVEKMYSVLKNNSIYSETVCLGPEMWDKLLQNKFKWEHTGTDQKFLIMTYPQVPYSKDEGSYFQRGEKKSIFFKYPNQTTYIGKFLNNISVSYPDFSFPPTKDWLEDLMSGFNFSGSFLQWNSPFDTADRNTTPCSWDSKQLPFLPDLNLTFLFSATPCANLTSGNNKTHWEVHNTYGHSHLEAMNEILRKNGRQRPLVLSSSTSAGSGAWGGQWIASSSATWGELKSTFVRLLDSSLAGLPLTGSSACGYGNFSKNDLCVHWLRLATFSPLTFTMTRFNHPDEYVNSLGKGFRNLIQRMTRLRLSLLPYLYTLFYAAHVKGTPVLRPLFFEFPNDPNVFNLAGPSFLWGRSLMVTTVLEDKEFVDIYFPNATWYDFYTGARIAYRRKLVQVASPKYFVNLYVRGGSIIATRDIDLEEELTTKVLQQKSFIILVALEPDTGKAEGSLYLDDGTTDMENGKDEHMPHLEITFTVDSDSYKSILTIETTNKNNTIEELKDLGISTTVKEIHVWGVAKSVSTVMVNGKNITRIYKDHILIIKTAFELYNKTEIIWNLEH